MSDDDQSMSSYSSSSESSESSDSSTDYLLSSEESENAEDEINSGMNQPQNPIEMESESMTTRTQNLIHVDQQQQTPDYPPPFLMRSYNYQPYQTNQYVPLVTSSNMYGQQPPRPILVLPNMQNESLNSRMANNSAMHDQTFTQRSVFPSSSRSRYSNLSAQRRFSPYARPREIGVLGSRRPPSYQREFQFREPSHFQSRRIMAPHTDIGPSPMNIGEERITNQAYSPMYESLGVHVDPHLRSFSMINRR